MSTDTSVRLPVPALERLISRCFQGLGLPAADCQCVAEALMHANLRGIDSHGLTRVPAYMRRVHAGLAGASDGMTVLARRGALCRMDAAHALGPPAAARAMDEATAIASELGVGVVALGNASNFGPAGYYALRAARSGLVGIVVGNAPKMMAPHGAREAFLGSNPLAIAVPMGDQDEFLLDISSTVTARGKLRRAQVLGQPIEPGVALDAAGQPTTDPAAALAGMLLPFSGPKGSGLALAITLLTGLLAGADFDDEVASIYDPDSGPQNLGQLFVAIDPWAVADQERARGRLRGLVTRLHAVAPDPGSGPPRYPGEAGADRARQHQAAGLIMESAELEAVARACRDCGLPQVAELADELIESGRLGGLDDHAAAGEDLVDP
jgi:LDH2 family malate/lactate/ureidoglycolate dehydrogenase